MRNVIPSGWALRQIIIFVMLDIVAQGALTMVYTLVLFLSCWTCKIITNNNKKWTTNATKESMRNHDVTSKGLWKNVYRCVLRLCWCCTPFFCTWWSLVVMYTHVLCYSLVLFTLRLIFIWGLESLSHLVRPHELD